MCMYVLQWERRDAALSSGQKTRPNSDLIQYGKSFVSDLSAVCKLIAIFHSYFSVSHPTHIPCLKAQTPMLQRSLKPEQDASQVYLHMTHRERQKYSVMTPVREIFFNHQLYLYTIFICYENNPAEPRARNGERTVHAQLKATAWHWEP